MLSSRVVIATIVSMAAIGVFGLQRIVSVSDNHELRADEPAAIAQPNAIHPAIPESTISDDQCWLDVRRPLERWLHKVLGQPVPQLDFQGNTPLPEVLANIAKHYTDTHGGGTFRMTILPDVKELDDAGIDLEDVIVSGTLLDGQSLENALELIFERANVHEELTYLIQNEVLLITTVAKAEEVFELRSYPIGHLLAVESSLAEPVPVCIPVNMTRHVLFGLQQETDEETFVDAHLPRVVTLIRSMTSPPAEWQCVEGSGGGTISLFGKHLIIRQSPRVHNEIVQLLNLLTKSAK